MKEFYTNKFLLLILALKKKKFLIFIGPISLKKNIFFIELDVILRFIRINICLCLLRLVQMVKKKLMINFI